MSKKKTSSDMQLLRHLSTYMRPYMKYMVLGIVMLLVVLAVQLGRPIIIKTVIDVGIEMKDMGIVIQLVALYCIVVCIGMVALCLETYGLQCFGQHIIYDIRNRIFERILSMSKGEFQTYSIGNLVTRVTNDTESLRTLYTEVIVKLGSSILQIIGIIGVMFWLNTTLATVILLLMPLFIGIIWIYQSYARKAFRGVRTKVAASNTSVQEMLNAIVMVKTYVGEWIMERSYDKVSREFLAAGMYEVRTFAIFRPLVDSLLFVAIISIFAVSGWFDSIQEAGTVFAFLQYIDRLFMPIKEIAEKYNSLQSAMAGAERIIPMLNNEKYMEEIIHVPQEIKEIREITFDHVYFSYDESEHNYVLEDINFTIKEGEFVGFVGPSGSGKSTIMNLLMAFETPTKGRILLNGHDIREFDPSAVREAFGYVFQDSHLFKGSIEENLTLYDEKVSKETIIEAAKTAHLHEMVENLEKGYDTSVGYLGSLLSQGQRQLLSLGRTLLLGRNILILDEATANIDSHTEELLQQSIESIRGEKTIISVAHRLSTLKKATRIMVMKQGHIIESGSFEDLMNKKGEFYELWNA